MNDPRLLVVGSVAYDDIDTPFESRKDLLGGSATYFSLAASHLVPAPRLVGVVGRDFGEDDRNLLEERGVDTTGLVTDESGDTFRWGGRYHDNMNDRTTLYTALNVFEHFAPVLPTTYKSSQWVFLGNIAPELQSEVLDQVDEPTFVALDTMNFWIEGQRDALLRALQRVHCVVINDEEGLLLTGEADWLSMARGIRALGPTTVIIKRGKDGSILYHDDTLFHAPAYPVERVVDPTGAGDTFAGGFMAAMTLANEISVPALQHAVQMGTVLASYCVEGFGVERVITIQQTDIERRVQQLSQKTGSSPWMRP